MPVPVSGPFLDLEVVFQPAADASAEERPCSASGLLFKSWSAEGSGSAALLYYWDSGVLEVRRAIVGFIVERALFDLWHAAVALT
jgi:hypothetical protein